jgi:hypothetical protein
MRNKARSVGLIIYLALCSCLSFGQVNFPATTTLPFLNSTNYKFTRTPGGTLTAATPATVTLSPMPLGIQENNYVYVSGGTGTAEAVLIASHTTTSITFTPANNHSGAWTVKSATAGIQEAEASSTSGKTVVLPAGTSTTYAVINIASPTNIVGNGGYPSSVIGLINTTQNGIAVNNANGVHLKDLKITGQGASMTAGSAIYVGSNTGISMDHLYIESVYDGVVITGSQVFKLVNCILSSYYHIGLDIDNAASPDTGDSICTDNAFFGATGALYGIRQVASGGLKVLGNKIAGNNYGYYMNIRSGGSTSILAIIGNSIEDNITGAIYCTGTGGTAFNYILITGNQLSVSDAANGKGVYLGATMGHAVITGNTIYAGLVGIHVINGATNVVVDGNDILGADTGSSIGIAFQASTTGFIGANNITHFVSSITDSTTVGGLQRSLKVYYNSDKPAGGDWLLGDIVINTAPASAGYVGWVCTVAGTPGTWKGFGVIE